MSRTTSHELQTDPPASPGATQRVLATLRALIADLVAPRAGIVPIARVEWHRLLMLWGAGRLFSLGLLFLFYGMSREGRWGFGPNGYPVRSFLSFLAGWDADRYGTIATAGYPTVIPVESLTGDVIPNNWAFLPVFPFLERVVTDVTGMPWQLAGVLLSIAASAGATAVLFVLLRTIAAPRPAWWAVVFFTFGPLSFVFVLAYAESLFLLLLFGALLLAAKRRYAWIMPLGIVAAFTRPGTVALAFGLGLVFLVRWFRRRVDPFPLVQSIGLLASGLVTAAAGLAWPFVADTVTRFPHAYVSTETSWWIPYIGRGDFVPFTPWFRFGTTYAGVFGVLLVLAVMGLFAAWIWSRPVRRLGLEPYAFAASYLLYLFAVFLPQQSILRLIMPLSPLLADDRLSSTRRRRGWMLGGCLVLQAAAVLLLWTIGHP